MSGNAARSERDLHDMQSEDLAEAISQVGHSFMASLLLL